MSWINTLGIWPWVIVAAIPPLLVLLYFLKLRRNPVYVPSTFLWTRTVEDLHVNTIWQRLRNNLLLLLQLLVVTFLILALVRPGCRGTQLTGDRFIFLIDNSASMSATDIGVSRLEDAKRQCRDMIDRMKPGDVGMLISFNNQASVMQSFTRSQSLLKRRVERIGQSERSTDMRQALKLASGLSNVGQTSDRESEIDIQVAESLPARVIIFSDGATPQVKDFALGNLKAEYRPIGAARPAVNVGITNFQLSRGLETNSKVQALVRLDNCHESDQKVDVTLFVDNAVFDAKQNVKVESESATNISFDLDGLTQLHDAAIAIRLEINVDDDYAQDNVAHAVWSPPRRPILLLLTPSNDALVQALSTDRIQKMCDIEIDLPSYLSTVEYQSRAENGYFDLVIYDQCAPQSWPQSNTVIFGATPPGEIWKIGKRQFPAPIILTSKTHPLSQNLAIGDVQLLEASHVTAPRNSVTLMESTFGSIMSIGPRRGFEDLVVGFSLVNYAGPGEIELVTDWYKHPSFPVFIHNLAVYMGRVRRAAQFENSKPGELIKLRTELITDEITVRKPTGGAPISLKPSSPQQFVFSQTDNVGVYSISESRADKIDQLFAVNLFDRDESDIRVKEHLAIGYEEIEGETGKQPARREFWPWLVGLSLGIVLLEWIIYSRRGN